MRAGQREKGQVEIVEGLSANDMVITAGHLKLPRPGMAVTIMPPGGLAPQGPGSAPKPPTGAAMPPADGAPSTANRPNPPRGG